MMKTIVNENQLTFKEFEIKIFDYVCQFARELTKTALEEFDEELRDSRNKKEYRNKGRRKTTIKTVYGEVEYSRNVYEKKLEDGKKSFIYLLDEAMGMDKIGTISTNLAEKICQSVTESSYRITADTISETCGQSISHGGVWKLTQKMGERITEEEQALVYDMDAGQAKGKRETSILFQEMDGVWLKMQGKDHKRMKKQEMKVAVFYEGWKKDGKKNSRLYNKTVVAGMEKSKDFHKKREAMVQNIYNVDEITQRVLNGDGGSWIKDTYDPDCLFQLDRFHIYQEIKRKISDKRAQKQIHKLFEQEKIEELLAYIQMYAESVKSSDESDKKSEKARELYLYLSNNKEGLIPYQSRMKMPEAPEGIVFKNMGVQENQNCTTITMRMKNRRMRWSPDGAGNMAKLLYRKENKQLVETIERYTDGIIFAKPIKEMVKGLSAGKTPVFDGKGKADADKINHHVMLHDAVQTASRKAFLKIFNC